MEYKKFILNELFSSQTGDTDLKQTHINGLGHPICSSGESNQGVIGYTDIPAKVIKGNSLTVDMFGNVFYRDFDYKLVTHARIFTLEGKYSKNTFLYFSACLKHLKKVFSYNDMCSWNKIKDMSILLPSSDGINPDYCYMDTFIGKLEQERIHELEQEKINELANYLKITSFNNHNLTKEEKELLNMKIDFKEFKITDIFKVVNTHSILKEDVVFNSGKIPYVTASGGNNSIVSYVNANSDMVDEGNCVLIGGKTMVVTYQEKDFVSNDSHNLALYLLDEKHRTKNIYLYLACAVYKSLGMKYHWGDSISKKKIYKDLVKIPIDINGNPYYNYMEQYINVIEKLVIKDVVEYKDQIIKKTKELCNI